MPGLSMSNSFDAKRWRTELNRLDDTELSAFCLDCFPDVYDAFSRGQSRIEKITILLDHCRRNTQAAQNLIRLLSDNMTDSFHLTFANREAEKAAIHAHRQRDLFVQIYAPGGLGKSFLLAEIHRELEAEGYTVILLDFVGGQSHCIANPRALVTEFYRHLNGADSPTPLTDEQLLEYAGRCLANTTRAALLLDNADRIDQRTLEWLRDVFFEKMVHCGSLWVLASGQQVIGEWHGCVTKRPFYLVSLSEFNDLRVIKWMIDDLTARCGTEQAKQRRTMQPDVWKQELETMATALLELSCGHPLAMERLLYEAWEYHGALRPDYLTSHRAELVQHCLAPLIGERILPTVDRAAREVFRSLCIFRYIWPGLIRTLLANNDWPPLIDDSEPDNHNYWWRLLQGTHLVLNVNDVNERKLYPLSPTVRRLIALVLEYEDPVLFRAHHIQARTMYSQMVQNPQVRLQQRAACWLESLFHAAKSGDPVLLRETLTLLAELRQYADWVEIQSQVFRWVAQDAELIAVVGRFLGPNWSESLA